MWLLVLSHRCKVMKTSLQLSTITNSQHRIPWEDDMTLTYAEPRFPLWNHQNIQTHQSIMILRTLKNHITEAQKLTKFIYVDKFFTIRSPRTPASSIASLAAASSTVSSFSQPPLNWKTTSQYNQKTTSPLRAHSENNARLISTRLSYKTEHI